MRGTIEENVGRAIDWCPFFCITIKDNAHFKKPKGAPLMLLFSICFVLLFSPLLIAGDGCDYCCCGTIILRRFTKKELNTLKLTDPCT